MAHQKRGLANGQGRQPGMLPRRGLLATGQLIGEGFDCPGLANLFLATPIRFSGRVLQYLGRVLRPAPGQDRARVYDYQDIHVGVLAHAARARARVYTAYSVCQKL